MAAMPQFQKNGAVPNRALTVGTPRTSWMLLTSGKFLKVKFFEVLTLNNLSATMFAAIKVFKNLVVSVSEM